MSENKKIPGMGFHHINLKASEFDKSLKFYTEALGLTPTYSWGTPGKRVQLLDLGDGGHIELCEDTTGQQNPGIWAHFAVGVDDTEKAFETAVSAGAEPMMAPKILELDSKPEKLTLKIAFVYGPDKEEIEFFKII